MVKDRNFNRGAILTDSKKRAVTGTGEEALLRRFPSENPNPVFGIRPDGSILYANDVAKPVLEKCSSGLNRQIPDSCKGALDEALRSGSVRELDVPVEERTYQITFIPSKSGDVVFAYGKDVTDRKKGEEILMRSRETLAKAQEIAHIGNWDWNIKTGGLEWSDEIYRIFGFKPQEFTATYNAFLERLHPDDRQGVEDAVTGAVAGKAPYEVEHRIVRPDGEERIVLEWGEVFYVEKGEPYRMLGIVQDITSRKRSEDRLKLARGIFENALEGVLVTDADGKIIMVNPAFTRITGYSAEEVLGQDPRILQSERQPKEFYEAMWKSLLTDGKWAGEIWNRRKNGEAFPENLSITAVNDKYGRVMQYVSVFYDLSEMKRSEEEITYKSNFDALTKLPNRTLFMDRLDRALVRHSKDNKELAVLYIGIDGFRKVNESMGYTVGDALLQAIAKRLTETIGKLSTPSRFGGDEYVILLDDIESSGQIAELAAEIFDTFRLPFRAGEESIFLTASVGVSAFPDDGDTSEILIKNSNIAMTQAKKNGRDRYSFFTPEMNERAVYRMSTENDLRTAIKQSQFVLYYQPKVELGSERVIGMEALIRWNHPTIGLMSPFDFIPVAEEAGIIVEMGNWIFLEACMQASEWNRKGFSPIVVAVNVSGKQFAEPDIDRKIKDILDRSGLAPELLQLEITESVVMENVESAIGILNRLKKLGLTLSIDDFGTGYSSFAYLKKFPLDYLKIDKVFVDDIATNEDDIELIAAIISMAHTLKLKVIAEGVETKEQVEVLKRLECDMIQGYYYGKPMPADEMEKFLAKQK
jgi:diguanylate cyclase (GGDEF)-like protein/PAS domain S-box-containing protein